MKRAGEQRVTWAMVAGLFLLVTSAAAYEIVPASVTPLLMDRFAIGPTAAGWLVSVMLGTAVLASVPVGIGLDRVDLRRAIGLATLVLVVAGIWGWRAATAGQYRSLVLSRLLGALAYTVLWNAGADIVGRSFPARSRGTAVGVFIAGGTAGFALGQVAGPPIADTLGLAAVFAVFGALSVAGLILFWPASARVSPVERDLERPDVGEFAAVLTSRRVWHVCALGFVAYALYLFFLGWMPTYLAEELGMSLAQSGLMVSVFAAVGIVSRTGGGVVSDRLFDARRRPVVRLGFAAAVPLVGGMLVVDAVLAVFALLVLAGFCIQLVVGLTYTYVRELVAPNVAATAIATLTAVSLFGGFAAPLTAGWLIGVSGFVAAFAVAGATAVLGVALGWFAPEPTPRTG